MDCIGCSQSLGAWGGISGSIPVHERYIKYRIPLPQIAIYCCQYSLFVNSMQSFAREWHVGYSRIDQSELQSLFNGAYKQALCFELVLF